MIKTAKEYENLTKRMRTLNEDKPEDRDFMIKDAIHSMMEKIEKTGTSQDPSECRKELKPVYSESTTYKGFAVIISSFKGKYIALARQVESDKEFIHNFKSQLCNSPNEAGREVLKYIDIFRKKHATA